MTGFDTFVVVDWSARSTPSPALPAPDAIWVGVARAGIEQVVCDYHRTRHDAIRSLTAFVTAERAVGRRVLLGFDFPFGYPRGFARIVTGQDNPLALWTELAERIEDNPDNSNNRFDVAEDLNRLCPGIGPFWGCPAGRATEDLPALGNLRRDHGLPERRAVEQTLRGAQPCWKLFTAGSVGSQALLGLARLDPFRRHFGDELAVAPFQDADKPIVLSEVWPSLLGDAVAALRQPDEILDRAQVRVLARALSRLAPDRLAAMLREGDAEEGTILGVGHVEALQEALEDSTVSLMPPPLRDDCFALPAGVDWTPVDEALSRLRAGLHCVVGQERMPLGQAAGRVLAAPLTAPRANPPEANSAVDGYGFAHASLTGGDQILPLIAGRAAAGVPFPGVVPEGHALRVLTGAALPEGVDTVILQEDVTLGEGRIAFRSGLKRGANTRRAGEDVAAGDSLLGAGRVLTPADLALCAAVGLADLPVRKRLRVAVLSTGDELVEAGAEARAGQIYDANRPMLCALVQRMGYAPIDLGRICDDRAALRAALDRGAREADVILTSGGASAGDEDHVSALLRDAGAMAQWRVAIKPGRPLALGIWRGVPVFGLPGNPVAALVCALVFARPAMAVLAGADWSAPQGIDVPAAFAKSKKPGRREYLRARLRNGHVEVFSSEGSGRISGLSWAEGLVELPDGAMEIGPGDLVRYLPYSSFLDA